MKKLLFLCLVFVLLAGIAGCGQTGGGPADGALSGPADIPTDERPTLRILMPFHPFDMNEDPTAEIMRELTGYEFIIENLPAENPVPALTAIIAAREEYDIKHLMAVHFRDTAALGSFQPLNDLLDVHAPNVREVTLDEQWYAVTMGNDILAIPVAINETSFVTWSIRARMDMLREVGIDTIPSTLDDFTYALHQIRDQLDVIPLSIAPPALMLQPTLTSPFGVMGEWNISGSEILHAVETPGMLEYITWMNYLFVNGLLDDEFATLTATAANEKFHSGRSAMHALAPWGDPAAINTTMETFPDAELAFVPPLEHNGVSGRDVNFGMARAIVIPRVARHQDHALNFINLTLEGDNFQHINIGFEGTHWEFDDNGIRTPIDPIFQDERGNAAQFLLGMPTLLGRSFWVEVRARRQMALFDHLIEVTNQAFDMVPISYPVGAFMPPSSEFLDNIARANDFATENLLLFVCNVRPLSEWEDFLDEWRRLYGGDIVTSEINSWWAVSRDSIYPILSNPVNPAAPFR